MTNKNDLFFGLIENLDYKGEKELSNIIKRSRIVYEKQYKFTGIVSNQRELWINIKTPVKFKDILISNEKKLRQFCFDLFESDDDYGLTEIIITSLASRITEKELSNIEKEIVKDYFYESFLKEIIDLKLDKIERDYLIEACECAIRNNRLAASTMLGCAAEYLLMNMCSKFNDYLKEQGTPKELENFNTKVIKAKCAYNRLDEFYKRAESKADIFEKFGFDNLKLDFSSLDIIRQARNDSGHPTGEVISPDSLRIRFGNYQIFLKKAHKLIKSKLTN